MSALVLIAATLSACGGGSEVPESLPASALSESSAQGTSVSATRGAVLAATAAGDATDAPSSPVDLDGQVDTTMAMENSVGPLVLAASPSGSTGSPEAETALTPVATMTLMDWNRDWPRPHEYLPSGVPTGFDWYAKGRVGAGNTPPAGFAAMIGWGQVFWAKGATPGDATVEIRNFDTYVCSGPDRQWVRVLGGEVTGAIFRPDYANNFAQSPLATSVTGGVRSATFTTNGAFHFWPAAGRSSIPGGGLCGVVVMLEARLAGNSQAGNRLVLGLGGDYWLSKTAAWDNYTTNKDWAVGRLKELSSNWRWYGMTTASDADLVRLNAVGFTDSAR